MEREINRPRWVQPDLVVGQTTTADQTRATSLTEDALFRDSVRWGPIWAGLITAFTIFLLLQLLMFALGMLTVGGPITGTAEQAAIWVTAIIGLLAFFLGGWVAASTAATRGTSAGLLNGFLVWGLGTVLMLAFSTLGLGQLFGAVGNVISQFLLSGAALDLGLGDIDSPQVAAAIRETSTWAFVSLLLAALAATIGGWAGSRGRPLGQSPESTEPRNRDR